MVVAAKTSVNVLTLLALIPLCAFTSWAAPTAPAWTQETAAPPAETTPVAPITSTTQEAPSPFSLGVSLEYVWMYLHPGADALHDTFEAYGYTDEFGSSMDLNIGLDLGISVAEKLEIGGHYGLNNLAARMLDIEGAVRISQEVGGYLRFVPYKTGILATALRLEGGVLLGKFTFRGVEDVYSMPYIRPAFCSVILGSQVSGDLCSGWTYAAAQDGLAPGENLPFGGFDVTITIRLTP